VRVIGQPAGQLVAAQDLGDLEPAVDQVSPRAAEAEAVDGVLGGVAVEAEEQEQVAGPDAATVQVPLGRPALAESTAPAGLARQAVPVDVGIEVAGRGGGEAAVREPLDQRAEAEGGVGGGAGGGPAAGRDRQRHGPAAQDRARHPAGHRVGALAAEDDAQAAAPFLYRVARGEPGTAGRRKRESAPRRAKGRVRALCHPAAPRAGVRWGHR
jgi:hypothetical protein